MIVFDLDDTLYKERQYVASGMRAVASKARKLGMDPDAATDMVWNTELRQAYRQHLPSLSLSPEAAYTMAGLQSSGERMAIITDGRSGQQRKKYDALRLNRYVPQSRLLISEEIGADKTEPLAFERIMADNPDECLWVYVGDNPAKDFHHPNLMGWTTVMLRDSRGDNVHQQTLSSDNEYNPKFTIESLTDLPLILKTILR